MNWFFVKIHLTNKNLLYKSLCPFYWFKGCFYFCFSAAFQDKYIYSRDSLDEYLQFNPLFVFYMEEISFLCWKYDYLDLYMRYASKFIPKILQTNYNVPYSFVLVLYFYFVLNYYGFSHPCYFQKCKWT